ncbi:beta-galactosidase 13-like [Amaranthus tricolor]|uniref:beta-galactosidase 13-like n=1 Tax=Amaranthus tricolor TaxID=29722 RepID=UPI002582B4D0|nr:beta-galactosidase 13-like [Amaranthus tricolor]
MAKCDWYMVILGLILILVNENVNCELEDDVSTQKPGKPSNVTYDGRSLFINGKREIFFSGSFHYPRAPPEMWGDILDKSKEGGLNTIDTYVFWNVHEPIKGQFNFTGNNDIVKFIKLIAEKEMWVVLRIGPFIQAEWNQGALPYWLREEEKIIFRTDNNAYKKHMEQWVTKIVNIMKDNNLFAPQGGPIILAQIENEYDHVKEAYDEAAGKYIQWAAEMAIGLKTGVPWIMCKSKDAPDTVINACNGRDCGDTFAGKDGQPNKPYLWTENWTARYRIFGQVPSKRTAEDTAFSVARWFSRNGSYVNYYMYYGGTNYGRMAGVFITPRYYDDAPIDEFGLIRNPKWGHLKDLHQALLLAKKPLLEGTWNVQKIERGLDITYFEKGKLCAAFLWNNHDHLVKRVKFKGVEHIVPPKSISILPDCKTVVYNSDNMISQHSVREFEKIQKSLKWEKISERIPRKGSIFSNQPREQFTTTKDTTDYLWYQTSVKMGVVDLLRTKSFQPVLEVLSLGHSLLAYVNGDYIGTEKGKKTEYTFDYSAAIRLKEGINNISILGCTVGLPESGSYMEKRYTGLRMASIEGLGSGTIDITNNGWHHTVGLEGERHKIFTEEGAKRAKWKPAQGVGEPLTWYKAFFDEPEGDEPLAIRMENMTKGMIWINGNNIGRYWSSNLAENKKPTQSEYHFPRSLLKPKDNMVVIMDEAGGNIDTVQIETVNRDNICSYIEEDWAPNVWSWKRVGNQIVPNGETPKLKANLKCPKDKVINHVEFASFGNPDGVCGLYLLGNCTSPNSLPIIEQNCLGKESCTFPVDRKLFDKDKDPCPQVTKKRLAVQVKCGFKG